MKKEKLLARLRQLYLLEFINISLLPCCAWIYALTRGHAIGLNSMVAMVLNGIVLLEGSYFWFSLRRHLKLGNQNSFVNIFKKAKLLNFILLPLAFIFIMINPFLGAFDKITTTLFFLLAVLEHVNYFEVQLMYDNKNDLKYIRQYGRLKVSKLNRAMKNNALDQAGLL